jgi:acetyl esterase/lipase
MRRYRVRTVTAAVAVLAAAGLALASHLSARAEPAPAAPATAPMVAPPGPGPIRTAYWYGPNPAQEVTVLLPARTRPQPVGAVLLLHGGAWVGGDKTRFEAQARDLAGRGYVAASANYRLAPAHPWPAQLQDARAALTGLLDRAEQYGLDRRRVVVAGESAGGHLALLLGTADTDRARVAAVASFSGVSDPARLVREPCAVAPDICSYTRQVGTIVRRDWLRCAPADCPRTYRAATASLLADRGDPPALLVASRGDFVPVGQTLAMAAALRRVGARHELAVDPGPWHGVGIPGAWSRFLNFARPHLGPPAYRP